MALYMSERDGAGFTQEDWEDMRFYERAPSNRRCLTCGGTERFHNPGCPAANDSDDEQEASNGN